MALTTAVNVKNMLRWGSAEATNYEDHLDLYIEAASSVIEDGWGPFEARSVVHLADGGDSVVLPYRVNAVTKVETSSTGGGYSWVDGYYVADAEWGETVDYTVDLNAGIVYGPFPSGRQAVRITFTVGYDTIPDAVTFAATSLVCHMWAVASQRGTGYPEDYTAVPTGFLVPNVVKEALAQYKTQPGFA